MNDESTQRDEQHGAAGRNDERDAAPASLPWLEDAVEELFGAAPLRSAPTKSAL